MMRPPSVVARLNRLADRLDDLARRSLEPWLDVGLAPTGGAYGFLDRHFVPIGGSPDVEVGLGPSGEKRGSQSLVQQARHLFSYSFMHARRPSDSRLPLFSKAIYEHLIDRFARDACDLGAPLLHCIPAGPSSSGSNPTPTHATAQDWSQSDPSHPLAVQLYSQAFAIYSFANYGAVFDHKPALLRARSLFLSLEQRRSLGPGRGFRQAEDGGWLAYVSAPSGAAMCTNTHIHLLEALVPLVRALPGDVALRESLLGLVSLIAFRFLQPSGYVHRFFSETGAPVGGAELSYGHDLETSWLLVDAVDALEESEKIETGLRARIEVAAETMARQSLLWGRDPAGGVYDFGRAAVGGRASEVCGTEKVWWAQAETLAALTQLHLRTGDMQLLTVLEQTFDFFSTKSWDEVGGEFFWGVDSQGRPGPRGPHKGEIWKTPYHGLRACILSADWIRARLD